MKTSKVKLKFNDLHTGQLVYIADGLNIYPAMVGKLITTTTCQYHSVHGPLSGCINLPYPESMISIVSGDKLPFDTSSDDEYAIVAHTEYGVARQFIMRERSSDNKVRLVLSETHFNQENTELRLFKRIKQAVAFNNLNLITTKNDVMDDIIIGDNNLYKL